MRLGVRRCRGWELCFPPFRSSPRLDSHACPSNDFFVCSCLFALLQILMLGIIVSLNFVIAKLFNTVVDGVLVPSTSTTYEVIGKLKHTRWLFLVYLLSPTVLFIMRLTVLGWKYEWGEILMEEVVVGGIVFRICHEFSPIRNMQTLRVAAALDAAAGRSSVARGATEAR
jgi:hypothetical protein